MHGKAVTQDGNLSRPFLGIINKLNPGAFKIMFGSGVMCEILNEWILRNFKKDIFLIVYVMLGRQIQFMKQGMQEKHVKTQT